MRMSSGPSKRNEKPRTGLSICGELTPRSISTPATLAAGSSPSAAKPWCRMEKRGPSMRAASATASGSLSKAISRPCGSSRERIRRECPPRPKVAST
jgi:hypothetical protein